MASGSPFLMAFIKEPQSASLSGPTCHSEEKATQDLVRITQAHACVADPQGWNSFHAQCGTHVVILTTSFQSP